MVRRRHLRDGRRRRRPQLGASTAAAATHFSRELISSGLDRAVAAAKAADTAVLVVGSNPFINGREAHDRASTALSAGQAALVKAVARANPRTVVVLQSSYPVSINWEQEHVPAVVWTTHAGAETGHAIADVLFGDRNPSGRLTQTWYRSDRQLPPDLLEYDIISSGQTYLYSTAKPLYPFGHGLSYTRFRYGQLRADAQSVAADGTISVSVDVTNVGGRAGSEVVQLYTHQRTSRDKTPIRQLKAFQQVKLAPGQTRTVTLRLPAADLAHWDVTRSRWVVESSVHDLMVGASAEDIRARTAIRVRGETIPARDLSRPTRAENFDRYAGSVSSTRRRPGYGRRCHRRRSVDLLRRLGPPCRRAHLHREGGQAGADAGTIQIRLGSPTGRLLGTAAVPSTGDVHRYVDTGTDLARAAGNHDVYLVFDSALRLADFSVR
ncbi:glycoside hydrolase family 3 C-terminal domain-containing protein [Micromonospora sp. M12]